MPRSNLSDRLRSASLLGSFVALRDPASVGLLAAAGFELVVMDREHGVMGPETASTLVLAAKAANVAAVVRIPEPSRSYMQDALESGADGVLVPMVECPSRTEQIVAWARYAPHGTRGFHPLTAGSDHGRIDVPELLDRTRICPLVAAQIETAAGLEACEAIAKVDGLDMLFFGPGDLAISLGVPPQSEVLRRALERVGQAARAHGKLLGAFVTSEEDASRAIQAGARLLVASADVALLSSAARALAGRISTALRREP
jgi:4-hydroxy-2-oxoheptanedioate aldolase